MIVGVHVWTHMVVGVHVWTHTVVRVEIHMVAEVQ